MNGRLVAMCPYDSTLDELLSDDDVRQFRLEADELCLSIREDSGLGGDGPKQLAPGIWLIGQTSQQDAPPRVIFVAFETGLGAAAIIAMLRRVAGPTSVSLLLAGRADLELRLALEDAGVAQAPIAELLVDEPRAPFRLDSDLLTSTKPQPRLVLRHSDRSVTFEGMSEILPPQPFKLLRFMLMEAEAGRPLIENRLIEKELWSTAIHNQQVANAVRRLRDALASILGNRKQAEILIQNRPGSYFINRDFAAIEII